MSLMADMARKSNLAERSILTLGSLKYGISREMRIRIRRALSSGNRYAERDRHIAEARAAGKQIVHSLHIGKTGGSAINYALHRHLTSDRRLIVLHGHEIMLKHVPEGDACYFFIREPVSRFVSGFYSRMRQGKPMWNVPWNLMEEIAFARFTTPNQLAEAITSADSDERNAARHAMRSILHVRTHYRDWLTSPEYLRRRSDDIILIGFQETLDEDFARLHRRLELPPEANLPRDDVKAHRSPSTSDKRLSELAVQNLKRWYAEDIEIYALCRELAGRLNSADAVTIAR